MSWRALLRAASRLKLASIDPSETPGFAGSEAEAKEQTAELVSALGELQTRLYASEQQALLVILQARDAAGKDGVVKKVIGQMNPFGFRLQAFKAPTEIEAAHDFLWRLHAVAPAKGEIVVFNRSHYEDVLIRRVHKMDPERRWRPRYAHIRAFEQLLSGDAATVLVKIFLHISKAEQAKRFRARLENPAKRWKFSPFDLEVRKRWRAYDTAYEDAINETNADHAPWYIVPADRKWYRDLAVAHLLHETLAALNLKYPPPDPALRTIKVV